MKLDIAKLDDASCLSDFRCGIPEMDEFIREGLITSILHHYCQAYKVCLNAQIVALFALSFDSLNLDSDDKNDMMAGYSVSKPPYLATDYKDIFLNKSHYPALEITYLAVDERAGKQGLGRIIVEAVMEKAQSQELAGCQFLTVEALHTKGYSAVGFYEKCGFSPCDYPDPNKDTLRMFRTLYPEQVTF